MPDGLRSRLQAHGISLPAGVWRGDGCPECRNTGYSGRIGVFEIMSVTPKLAELISENVAAMALRAQAREDGMRSILEEGLDKVAQ